MAGLPARVSARTPPGVKRGADLVTRRYAVLTAAARPLPDFLLIGAKRGGTTSLWNYLAAHPYVLPMFPTPRRLKSPAYFFENSWRGESWYRSHFHTAAYRRLRERRAGGHVVTGESSPYYLYDPRIPRRVAELMPDVKVIALLRNPVARAYSHYWERVGQGVEPLGFEQALDAEAGRLAGERERMAADPAYYSRAHDHYSYRDRGIYLPQVQAWHAALPRAQVLILRSEDLYRDEQAVLDQTSDFLGVRRHTAPAFRRHNHLPVEPMPAHVRAELSAFYRPHNERLYAYLGRDFGWD